MPTKSHVRKSTILSHKSTTRGGGTSTWCLEALISTTRGSSKRNGQLRYNICLMKTSPQEKSLTCLKESWVSIPVTETTKSFILWRLNTCVSIISWMWTNGCKLQFLIAEGKSQPSSMDITSLRFLKKLRPLKTKALCSEIKHINCLIARWLGKMLHRIAFPTTNSSPYSKFKKIKNSFWVSFKMKVTTGSDSVTTNNKTRGSELTKMCGWEDCPLTWTNSRRLYKRLKRSQLSQLIL